MVNAGGVIAIGVFATLAGGIAYGLSFDARRWFEDRQWRRDEHRAAKRLARAREAMERFEIEECRKEAIRLKLFADQVLEIRNLPTFDRSTT